MDSLNNKRKAAARFAARAVGLLADLPREMIVQQRAARQEFDILMLPVDARDMEPLQDLDPESPTFGQPFYMLGYDGLGSAPLG